MTENKIQLYEINRISTSELDALGDYSDLQYTDWDPAWYYSFCSISEVKRAMRPQTPKDYLLRERIKIIADNTRYTRVFSNKKKENENYSLEAYFSNTHYNRVLKSLSSEDKEKCKNIIYGDIFTKDVNGCVWKLNNNICASINYSLTYFLQFCNLALLPFNSQFPDKIRTAAARIATRIFLNKESLDFGLDPRGIIPNKINKDIKSFQSYELQYIAGHEFAHYLLGHLQNNNFIEGCLFDIETKQYTETIYNESQKYELEADLSSLQRPQYSKSEYEKIYRAALLWFISLDVIEQIESVINPTDDSVYKTHPSAKQRYQNIIDNTALPKNFDYKFIETVQKHANHFADYIKEEISTNYEIYDFYGSVYLDEPNTKWRGKELIDRIDY